MFLLGDVDPHHYPLSQRISRNASLEVSSYELVNFRLIALQVATSLQRVDWGMRLVRLLASPFGRRVSSLAGGEKRDSEEPHLVLGWAYRPPPPAQVRMAPLLRNAWPWRS